jgi:hypothetical protein
MKKLAVLCVLGLVLVSSCKKDPPINQYKQPVYPLDSGVIGFTLNNNVTLKQVVNVLTGLKTDSFELYNFYYTKAFPNDSMTYYWHIIKSCSYIIDFNISKSLCDSFTMINSVDFKYLDSTKLANWSSIVQQQKFIEMPNSGWSYNRYGFLYVPNGQETLWLNKLKNLSIISTANLEYIYPCCP